MTEIFRADPEQERSSRPADTYDVVAADGLPVHWLLANLTHQQATEIAAALNQAVRAA